MSGESPRINGEQQEKAHLAGNAAPANGGKALSGAVPLSSRELPSESVPLSESVPPSSGSQPLSEETLHQLERICERLGADRERAPQMARQLVKRAGQLAVERDWSEAQALEYLLSLMLKASAGGYEPQSPQ